MIYSAKSDKGKVREKNEDCYNIISGSPDSSVCFIIADGMGGHNSGEIASKSAVDYISNQLQDGAGLFDDGCNIIEKIKKLIAEANHNVYTQSIENSCNYGMGTTLILAVILDGKMYIGHAGDSRLYLIRENDMNRITTDHSFVEELIQKGSITREEAAKHPKKNIITRALGMEILEVDTYICELKQGDSFLMCTDGLTNMLNEEEIKQTVIGNMPDEACEELISKANRNGGEDNITVIVIKNG